MNSSRFLHVLTQDTNHVYNVGASDGEIYQLAQQSWIVVSILKEWRRSIPKLWAGFHGWDLWLAPKMYCLLKHVKGILLLGQSELLILMSKLNPQKVSRTPQVTNADLSL